MTATGRELMKDATFINKRNQEQLRMVWHYESKIMQEKDQEVQQRLEVQLQSAIAQLNYFRGLRQELLHKW